ncbi:MAG TPA: Asp-tRNA(Asn)/Glu-tRNA(Gln) amidotransferase subunit GatA [Bacteroidota bacterium]|nr:Asp-tRNA(Asn)/Glu-tRNA(Gln) amidotransferase subunit GatA [Bacteroidota bacterium]
MAHFENHTALRSKLEGGETTCEKITGHYLRQMEAKKSLNAFLAVFSDDALNDARAVDRKLASGTAGPLAGMVMGVKDLICVKGKHVTCASRILENFVSPYDATVVRRLRLADAIIVGKTNMDEFAMGSSTENSAFGAAKNPADETRVPGGSSGGSAVAVAAGLATTALGSDTGGSIRQPAALCGVVGLKPTYGRVSRYGLVAFASSFDQIGPFGTCVADVASVLQVIAGHDTSDSTSAPVPVPDYLEALTRSVKGIRIGLPKEYYNPALDPEISNAIMKKIDVLKHHGAVVKEVSLPHSDYTVAAYYILSTAEASSNLARYDGARYGKRAKGTGDLFEMYARSRSEGFGDEVKRRIMLGTYVLSAGYYDAYYRKGQKVRRLIKEDFDKAFHEVDCLIGPTTPTTAFRIGEKMDDPLKMYLNDIYTVSANLAGIPGISIPCGKDSKGLPIGLQILGKQFDEETILRLGNFLERNPG